MSKKRFGLHEYGDFYDNKAVTDDGHKMDEQECADLLNEQAETIEVLREWIRKCGQKLVADEREIIENSEFSSPEDLLEANRRIAAWEGK